MPVREHSVAAAVLLVVLLLLLPRLLFPLNLLDLRGWPTSYSRGYSVHIATLLVIWDWLAGERPAP